MSTSKNFQNHPNFVPYRPNSPKMTAQSPTSGGTSQNQTYTGVPHLRTKQNSQVEGDHFATIKHENSLLREENKALKR